MVMGRSGVSELRELFETSIRVRDIAEPLASFDSDADAVAARKFMKKRGYDMVGVRREGVVTGYAELPKLSSGTVGDAAEEILPVHVLPEGGPMLSVFSPLVERGWSLVTVSGHVWGIVTVADIDKMPVRMYLFGLVSLLEMQLLRIVRVHYPADSWAERLRPRHQESVRKMFVDRRRDNAQIELADCLQFDHKIRLVAQAEELRQVAGFDSK